MSHYSDTLIEQSLSDSRRSKLHAPVFRDRHAHNMAPLVARTLQSVERAVQAFRTQNSGATGPAAEIIVVDDGSTDDTWPALNQQAAGKSMYRLLRHTAPTSPSYARNAGVKASSGELLFFLDGDDLFYPEHIQVCQWALADPSACFVKTQVHLADPVHADWRERINHSLVINLCVPRWCHEAVGGFPDYHLFRRMVSGGVVSGEWSNSVRRRSPDLAGPTTVGPSSLIPHPSSLSHESDLFYKFEDQYYNDLITRLFPGVAVPRETVEYLRSPGNSFDRQYEKYQHPFGAFRESLSEEDNFRLALCDAIVRHRRHVLEKELAQNLREAAQSVD